ncbi:hypothetical protein D3C78_1837200 [compost metagenome]
MIGTVIRRQGTEPAAQLRVFVGEQREQTCTGQGFNTQTAQEGRTRRAGPLERFALRQQRRLTQ